MSSLIASAKPTGEVIIYDPRFLAPAAYQNEVVVCRDCFDDFVFTEAERRRLESMGFTNRPVRCVNCRRAARVARGDVGQTVAAREDRRHAFFCASCGRADSVAFEPKFSRPLLCRWCHRAARGER